MPLLLDERITADGSHARTFAALAPSGDGIELTDDDGTRGHLSFAALDKVMTRYGRELDPEIATPPTSATARRSSGLAMADTKPVIAPTSDVALDFPGGHRLRRFRHHAPVDATGRDYLVWEAPGAPPLAVVATMATAALRYLVLNIAAARFAPDPSS